MVKVSIYVASLFLFVTYHIIEALYNRLNLRFSQKWLVSEIHSHMNCVLDNVKLDFKVIV